MKRNIKIFRYISIKARSFIIINVSLFLVLLLTISCSDNDSVSVDPPDDDDWKGGVLTYNTGSLFDNKPIHLHYYIPKGDVSNMTFQFILHGMDRNARDYLRGWQNSADKYGLIIVAPEFSKSHFSSTQYNEGMFLTPQKKPADPEKTLFSQIDLIFESCIDQLKLKNNSYNIYGHSAGGQFVHRFMQFYDSRYLQRGVAANSGWYTFPDESISYPYGIKGLFSDNEVLLISYYQKELTILLGEADTKRSSSLRQTPEADNQGLTRFTRGINFYESNKNRANKKGYTFNWTTKHVPKVGHDHKLMSPAAADFLYGNK